MAVSGVSDNRGLFSTVGRVGRKWWMVCSLANVVSGHPWWGRGWGGEVGGWRLVVKISGHCWTRVACVKAVVLLGLICKWCCHLYRTCNSTSSTVLTQLTTNNIFEWGDLLPPSLFQFNMTPAKCNIRPYVKQKGESETNRSGKQLTLNIW